jgi:hypothetical protein
VEGTFCAYGASLIRPFGAPSPGVRRNMAYPARMVWMAESRVRGFCPGFSALFTSLPFKGEDRRGMGVL